MLYNSEQICSAFTLRNNKISRSEACSLKIRAQQMRSVVVWYVGLFLTHTARRRSAPHRTASGVNEP